MGRLDPRNRCYLQLERCFRSREECRARPREAVRGADLVVELEPGQRTSTHRPRLGALRARGRSRTVIDGVWLDWAPCDGLRSRCLVLARR